MVSGHQPPITLATTLVGAKAMGHQSAKEFEWLTERASLSAGVLGMATTSVSDLVSQVAGHSKTCVSGLGFPYTHTPYLLDRYRSAADHVDRSGLDSMALGALGPEDLARWIAALRGSKGVDRRRLRAVVQLLRGSLLHLALAAELDEFPLQCVVDPIRPVWSQVNTNIIQGRLAATYGRRGPAGSVALTMPTDRYPIIAAGTKRVGLFVHGTPITKTWEIARETVASGERIKKSFIYRLVFRDGSYAKFNVLKYAMDAFASVMGI